MIDSYGPDWILAPSPLERHRDHVAVAEAAICAWQASATEAELFLYEVSQPVAATHVVDVTPWQDRKRKALSVYRLPLAYCDYETISRSLMAYRAHCLAPGAQAVEALQRVDRAQGLRLLAAMRRLREAME
ncbi:hypothetical protein MIT9_P0227 [Methylomarinovum caldicuralii]|uniref:Uncharacterized protein n=2 Tax=Methylomarinovum caldicuralii TaxID=438856 RepID=A0AAU9BZH6_9GAMM|nr:hypothetical protein MIT9_P0227 [Methylomarinovum caldicuralii]